MDNIQGNHSIQDTTFEIEEPLNVEELMASLPLDKDDLKENVIVMSLDDPPLPTLSTPTSLE
jgi:hypothetical protein